MTPAAFMVLMVGAIVTLLAQRKLKNASAEADGGLRLTMEKDANRLALIGRIVVGVGLVVLFASFLVGSA